MAELVTVGTTRDLDPGDSTVVTVGGEEIALFRIGDEFHAIGNRCTHSDGSLAEGMLVETTVTCPLHGSAFDVCSGEVLGPPAAEDVPAYDVTVEGEEIKVAVGDR